jgi:hypothetical protein
MDSYYPMVLSAISALAALVGLAAFSIGYWRQSKIRGSVTELKNGAGKADLQTAELENDINLSLREDQDQYYILQELKDLDQRQHDRLQALEVRLDHHLGYIQEKLIEGDRQEHSIAQELKVPDQPQYDVLQKFEELLEPHLRYIQDLLRQQDERQEYILQELKEQFARIESDVESIRSGLENRQLMRETDEVTLESLVLPFNDVMRSFTEQNVNAAPNTPGVYALYQQGELVYFGSTSGENETIRNRLQAHFHGETKDETRKVTHYQREVTETRSDAIARRRELVEEFQKLSNGRLPRYNSREG